MSCSNLIAKVVPGIDFESMGDFLVSILRHRMRASDLHQVIKLSLLSDQMHFQALDAPNYAQLKIIAMHALQLSFLSSRIVTVGFGRRLNFLQWQ